MFGAIAGGIASALAGGAMSKLFGGGQKAASGGIQGDVLATDNNTVGMGDAGIKSAIQGPLPTVNTTGYIDHAAFLGTINPDTNKIPKHLFQGYLNIYNNYFKAPWMPDR